LVELVSFLRDGEKARLDAAWDEIKELPRRRSSDLLDKLDRHRGPHNVKLGRSGSEAEIYKAYLRWLFRLSKKALEDTAFPYRSRPEEVVARFLEHASRNPYPEREDVAPGLDPSFLQFGTYGVPPQPFLSDAITRALNHSRRGATSFAVGIVCEILWGSDSFRSLRVAFTADQQRNTYSEAGALGDFSDVPADGISEDYVREIVLRTNSHRRKGN
jgi:hypothetical protein